jgi:hypothetical protein
MHTKARQLMNGDLTRKPNGDVENRVVRLEVFTENESELLSQFRDDTRENFRDFRAEIRGVRVEIRILTGMLFTVVLAVVAILAKVYGA